MLGKLVENLVPRRFRSDVDVHGGLLIRILVQGRNEEQEELLGGFRAVEESASALVAEAPAGRLEAIAEV